MFTEQKITTTTTIVITSDEDLINSSTSENLNYTSTNENSGKLAQFYKLTKSLNSSINSGIYSVTGINLSQKKLIISFLMTLIGDFGLAYGVRGSLKLIPKLLVKMIQNLRIDIKSLFKESFDKETAKFGLFVSLFFSSYKVSEKIISHWNGPSSWLAGTIASMSLIIMKGEEASFRWGLAQYVSVRAAQCLYNHLIRLNPPLKPFFYYGDVALFSLSSAQLMYGYFVKPKTLDREYREFIERLTGVDRRIFEANGRFLRETKYSNGNGMNLLNLALLLEEVHSLNPLQLPLKISESLLKNETTLNYFPCEAFHYGEICWQRVFGLWRIIFQKSLPMYFSLHLVPSILFKMNKFLNDPVGELSHTIRNSIQSSSFLATSGAIFQSLMCSSRVALNNSLIKKDWKYYYWLIGLVAGLGILVEKKQRRSEMVLYILPKAIQALYRAMLNRNLIIKIPNGEYFLFSISISVLMNYYRKEPEVMTPLVSHIFKRFL